MCALREQQTASRLEMSPLRQLINGRNALLLAAGATMLLWSDLRRAPAHQATAAAYVAAVHAYQFAGRPVVRRFAQCRYTPTCSEYSIEAVRRHGLLRGLDLTVRRVVSCTSKVPLGTADPVP